MKTINPYLIAAATAARRLRWDAGWESHRSRGLLRRWRGARAGQRAVICCNGPSLNRVDFEALAAAEVFCIGLNKINLLFERTCWRPGAICASNLNVIEQNAGFYNETGIPLFLDSGGRRWVRPRTNVAFLHYLHVNRFAEDVSMSYVQGSTVTYMALQVAFHLGIREVALVGCDHSFATKGPAHQAVKAGETDPNHFDPRYFSGGVKWDLPDLIGSEYFYALAERHYRNAGRRIWNCTEGGKLELYERKPLAEFLAGAKDVGRRAAAA